MKSLTKKRVIIAPEQVNAQVGAFFSELNIELSTSFEKEFAQDYLFIIDDFLPEIKSLPRIQTKANLLETCKSEVRAFIDIKSLESVSVKKLLGTYFTDAEGMNFIDRFSSEHKDVFTLKIHDYLNIGYFIDTIVSEAYKQKFDFERIRNYLNIALPFTLKNAEKTGKLAPIDVSYSYSGEGFALFISSDFGSTFNDFKKISLLSEVSNCFDINHFAKRGRIQMSSLWFNDESLRNSRSYFFTETSSNKSISNDASLINRLDIENSDLKYQPEEKNESITSEVIKGKTDEQLDEFQRVLGNKTPEELSVLKISGGSESEDEAWRVKALGLGDKIKEEVIRIKSSNQEVDENDLVTIIKNELDADVDKTKFLVKGSFEEVDKSLELKHVQSNLDVTKLEIQVARMKKVIIQMKHEMQTLMLNQKATVSENSDNGETDEENPAVLRISAILNETLEKMKAKESNYSKQRSDFEKTFLIKENKIKSLEEKIESMKKEYSLSSDFANAEKLEQLEVENKSLSAKLDLANRKVNIINENMEKQELNSDTKKDKEIMTLKDSIQVAQKLIEKFKLERNEMEIRLNEEKDRKSLSSDDKKISEQAAMMQADSERLLTVMAAEKKILEEKFKTQGIELKKVEQKLKFTISQLEEFHKKKGSQQGGSGAKSNDIYIKQLESANSRLVEANSEVIEKKKDLIKLKQENSGLLAKITELEKKLGIVDKKAA